ncbi:MAG: ATP-grasp domain-containing protein [Betaproteobacteria bacterium]|nr:ATP-grasp domain-containing protein [Betaproteobacteria bacterium]
MTTPILLVCTASRWQGTARIPRSLARAGFEVALLAPRASLAERSRFVAKIGHLPDGADARQWLHAFAAMVKAVNPRIVLPCDDMAFQLMQRLVLSPPIDLQPALHLELAGLVRNSLGDPKCYAMSVDKTLLPAAAEALGVRVAPYAIVADADATLAFANTHGYPIVLKRSHGYSGSGIAIINNDAGIPQAIANLTQLQALDLGRAPTPRLLVQAFVAGHVIGRSSAAWSGHELCGVTREKVMRDPPDTGPATVMRYYHDPEARAFSEALIAGLGIAGIVGIEYVVSERTGELSLLEINRRVTPGSHTGELVGIDLSAALHAAITGAPSAIPQDVAPGFERIVARFPQEWLRDPASPYLRDYPVDAPWDDPDLFEAMLAMRDDT